MSIFRSKTGEWKIVATYMDKVRLKRGGNLSLYWVCCRGNFASLIVKRVGGKVKGEFVGPDWSAAVHAFHKRLIKEAVRSKPRRVHELALRLRENCKGYRCIALCKTQRQVVDVRHRERIGAIALAFKALNKLCECRHRKQYEILEDQFNTDPKRRAQMYD